MESLSIEQINKLQEENETYKQSEQEASEIIAELKHKNKTLKKKLNCFKAALTEINSIMKQYSYSNITAPVPVKDVIIIQKKLDEALK